MLRIISMIITFYLFFSSGKASKLNLRRHLVNNFEGILPLLRLSEPGEETWVLESIVGTPLIYEIQGLSQKYFERNGIVSGQDSITLSVATILSSDTIAVGPGAQVSITPGGGDERRRRLASKTGTHSVLVVRVSTTNSSENPERSAVQLSSDCFGIGATDTVQMVSRFDDCSGGKLKLIPATNTSKIINGVVDVSITISATGVDSTTMENAARAAAEAKVGSLSQWSLVMFTWTKHANWGGAAAYAYVNGQVSCYRDSYIWKMGIQLHEIGHNLGLLHSGENVTYDGK
jgi:Gametolysin peptidase M11